MDNFLCTAMGYSILQVLTTLEVNRDVATITDDKQ